MQDNRQVMGDGTREGGTAPRAHAKPPLGGVHSPRAQCRLLGAVQRTNTNGRSLRSARACPSPKSADGPRIAGLIAPRRQAPRDFGNRTCSSMVARSANAAVQRPESSSGGTWVRCAPRRPHLESLSASFVITQTTNNKTRPSLTAVRRRRSVGEGRTFGDQFDSGRSCCPSVRLQRYPQAGLQLTRISR